MEPDKSFFVFISYSSLDNEWAIWLRHELEHYHLPASFNGRTDVRDNLRKVFRDRDELSAGPEWDEQVHKALEDTNNLIVVCSPHSAKSEAVNKEVEIFIALGKEDHIFPFIVEGGKPDDCFPPALRHSKLGGDVNKDGGRDSAFIKVVAGMLKVSFPSLWNRYEIEKAEEERKIREQRDKLLIMQSRFLAEKANSLVEEGDSYTARLLALEALPKDMENLDRPYVLEAEIALRKANIDDRVILKGHNGTITSVAFSPNGNLLASASCDNIICVWDVHTGKHLFKLDRPSMLSGKFRFDVLDGLVDEMDYKGFNSLDFSPDGNLLVSAGKDSTIYVWDLSKRECLTKIYNYDIHYGVNCVVFTLDGKAIISGGEYLNEEHEYIPAFSVWDPLTGNHLLDVDTQGDIYDINISNDGTKIATASYNCLNIWDSKTFRNIKRVEIAPPKDYLGVSKCVFSPNGELIASASNYVICIWKVSTGKKIATFEIPNGEIKSAVFSPDGRHIFIGTKGGGISTCDINTGKCHPLLNGYTATVNAISLCPINNHIVFGGDDNTIKLMDIYSDKSVLSCKIPQIQTKDSQALLTIQDKYQLFIGENGALNIIDARVGKIVKSLFVDKSEKKCYNTCHSLEASYNVDNNDIMIDNHSTRVCYGLANIFPTEICHMAISPDTSSIMYWSFNQNICVVKDLNNLEEYVLKNHIKNKDRYFVPIISVAEQSIQLLYGHSECVTCAAYSPDGHYVVSSSEDNTIRIWDVQTGKCIQVYNNNDELMSYVDFTPDGKYIISISFNATLKVWCFLTLQEYIDRNRKQFKNRQLTPEERKKYFLD